jgi:hypothetical protein
MLASTDSAASLALNLFDVEKIEELLAIDFILFIPCIVISQT